MRLNTESIQYAQNEPHKLMNLLNSIVDVMQDKPFIKLSASTATVTQAAARAGTTRTIRIEVYSKDPAAGGLLLDWLNCSLTAAVTETISDATVTPAVDDATPAIVNGVGSIVLTLPADADSYIHGETITVTVGGAINGATLTDKTYVVTISDTTLPTLATATVNADSLVLTFSEVLDNEGAELPDAADFAVKVAGSADAVTNVAVSNSGKTVTLTLTAAATSGQTVTCSYTKNATAAKRIKDAGGNEAAAFTDTAVTNNTP
jgi:uncharacterized repeat protein (TIGR02059 family)